MSLTPGTRLGSYEITGKLGEGGMGEVYRARDTALGRDVAVKVLPAAVATDPDSLARFRREAEALAALNHPNIAQVYGLERSGESPAIVMELVEGPTLADRIATGALPLDEALPIARQVAEALEAAHERGIIHRDLKPANIKVRDDGTVKVLDFGLAKALGPETTSGADAANSPTLTARATQLGMILGTAAYMSPEQARGKHVDRRTDVWAFGVVLYEMLTGRRLFEGEDVSEILAAVLRADLDWSALPAGTPPAIRRVLRRALQRRPQDRLPDMGTARLEIAEVEAGATEPIPAQSSPTAGRLWPALAAISTAAAVLLALLLLNRPAAGPPELLQFELPGRGQALSANAISPDGRQVAYVMTPAGSPPELWVRSLDSLAGRPVAATQGVRADQVLVWSPDSRTVAFSTARDINRVDLATGQVSLVTSLSPYTGFGYGFAPGPGAWSRDGTIIYGERGFQQGGVLAVPETGGGPAVPVTQLAGSERSHSPSTFLPDGRRFLYLVNEVADQPSGIRIGSLDLAPDEQDPTMLLSADSALYTSASDGGPDYIVFVTRGTLMAQPFDPEAGRLVGDAVALASGVGSRFSMSTTGRLVYRVAGEVPETWTTLVRRDRTGRQMATIGPPARYTSVGRFADGLRLGVGRVTPGENQHGYVVDLARDAFTRPNSGPNAEGAPIASPDDVIAFSYAPDGPARDIYVRSSNGAGDLRLLLRSDSVKHPNGWSPDGQWLIFDVHHPERYQDLLLVNRDGGDPVPFLETDADESFGQFSPDGRWIAYYSRESGQDEVYVRDFAPDRRPAHGLVKIQVSVDGGNKPRWSANGREIFFLRPDGMLVAVPVTPGPPFRVGAPQELFHTDVSGYMPYTAMPDGSFVINTPIEIAPEDAPPMVVMVNWQEMLRRQEREGGR